MNDQLNEHLVSLMDYIGSIAKDADAFARAQLPDVAREIVAWELWSSVFFCFTSVAILALCIWVFRKALRAMDDAPDGREIPMFMFSTIVGLISIIAILVNGHAAVKAAVAPRLVILDYVKKAMR